MKIKVWVNNSFKPLYFAALVVFVVFGLALAKRIWAEACSSSNPCSFGQLCSNGVCVDNKSTCVPKSSKGCYNHDVYWYDSCGVRGEMFQDCGVDSYLSEYRCSSSMVQQKVVARGCDQAVCQEVKGWIDLQNCADKGLVCRDGACQESDIAPPILYYLSPSGMVDSQNIVLSLTTNEVAECHYSYYDVGYEQMGMKFTANGVRHSAEVILNRAGDYVFYVRCRDVAGNINLVSSKIFFTYKSNSSSNQTNEISDTGKDVLPPVIQLSSLSPKGKVKTATIELSLKTDERASCRYDLADVVFESMENFFDSDSTGTSHYKAINLSGAGRYAYYVRCKNAAGNTNTKSSIIEFEYESQSGQPDLVILSGKPSGTVYQKVVALEIVTNVAAGCRYSTIEADYDSMEDLFSTNNGLQHVAVVTLGDYGSYTYNVGCRDNKDAARKGTTQISFEFKDLNATDSLPEAECKSTSTGSGDSRCNPVRDCVCDPDCAENKDQTDPDCINMHKDSIDYPLSLWIWIAGVFAAGVIGFVLIKKRSSGESDDSDGGGEEGKEEFLGL